METINNILLKAPKKEITPDELVYRKLYKEIELEAIKYKKKIRETGIVDLMELVRDSKTVTFFENEEADIRLSPLMPQAVLRFNQAGSKYGYGWDEVSAEFDEKGKLVIKSAKSVVVDEKDKSSLVKIFGEALADPKRVFIQTHRRRN